MILDFVDDNYVVLVEFIEVLYGLLFLFSREGGKVWVGLPLYFEQGLYNREANVNFKFSFKREEGFDCRGARACLVCEFVRLREPFSLMLEYNFHINVETSSKHCDCTMWQKFFKGYSSEDEA